MTSEPEHLQRLNPEQHKAVTVLQGPVLVLAGAGSGKTRVLTRRIAHLLHTGVAAQNVLAMTFTNKAATEMRERVEELVGEAGKRLWVTTFHSACIRILRVECETVGLTKRFAIYDDDDQEHLLREIVRSAGREVKESRDFLKRIDWFKNRMMTPQDVIDTRRSHPGDPIIAIWKEYEESLAAADAVDYNDIIGRVVGMFQQHPEVLARWRERFRYVLVDEYQDTNRAQYLLLRLLADEHRNLTAVGDDDQSIYGFRGADVSNILNFQQDFPEATVIRLEQNYRSSGHILQLANAVVAHNTDRLEKKLWTEAANGPKIQLVVAAGPREEGVRVADAVGKVRRMGIPYGDVAVIYRTNAIARHFEAAFRAARIPHRVVGGRKFYERREIRDVLAYLRLIVNPADDAAFLRVVNVPSRGVGAKSQAQLRADAAGRGQPLLATARTKAAGKTAGEKGLAAFVQLVDQLADQARDAAPDELIAAVIERSGYRAMLEGEAAGDDDRETRARLENLDALVLDARQYEDAPGAVGQIDRLTAWLDRVVLTADADDVPDGGEVTLLTAHSAKGLEFPVVFVVQMNEGVFPHERSSETGLEEERRLAYVAFTRAMQRLVVTRSLRDITGSEQQPSRFLFGVPTEVLDGDVPGGEPVQGERERRQAETAATSEKLAVFLEHRRQRAAAPPIGERHTLVEIESLDDLVKGVRILHPRHGVGEIVHVVGTQLRVSFGGAVRVIQPTRDLRIVAD